jgi:sporulation protein YlmC with PRC-barrel domain
MQTTAPNGADARKLIGRNIKNTQNDTIGEIKSIHLDPGGKVDAVIASVGGFLGIGDREVLLDWRDLQIDANGEVVRVNMTKDQLKAKPAYSYKDQATRGTVFSDRGVYTDKDHADAMRNDRAADRRNDTASTTTTRSTGDFNAAGQMSGEAVIGKTVKNASNENVGKIDDVYLDASGAVKLVVVSVGGFLGVGTKNVAVPWSDLKFGRDGNDITVTTNWTKDSLKAMPDYKDERRMPATKTSGG